MMAAVLIVILFQIGKIYNLGGGLGRIFNMDILESLTAFDENFLNQLTSGRYSGYKLALELFKKHPITGNGWGYFALNNYNPYLGISLSSVHSIYIQLLCDTGIVGLLLFLSPAFYSINSLVVFIRKNSNQQHDEMVEARISLMIQLFILIYGLFGIVFDIPFYYTIYFYSVYVGLEMKGQQHEAIQNRISYSTRVL